MMLVFTERFFKQNLTLVERIELIINKVARVEKLHILEGAQQRILKS